MTNKYVNYYNGEKMNIAFFFDGIIKEEAKRLQAYMLQDSHFIIDDNAVLDKLSENQEEIVADKDYTVGHITISSDENDKGHFKILGCSKTIDSQNKESALIYRGDIYAGLNCVAIVGLVQDEQTNTCHFSEVNWCYEKSVDPTSLTRYNIKRRPLNFDFDRHDSLDLEGEDLVYTVSDNFRITDDPTSVFKKSKKEIKVKKR